MNKKRLLSVFLVFSIILMTAFSFHSVSQAESDSSLSSNPDLSVKRIMGYGWDNSIELSWTPVENTPVSGYIIVWSTSDDFKDAKYKKIKASELDYGNYLELGDRICYGRLSGVRDVYSPSKVLSAKITGLKYNKEYNVTIEGYNTINGQDYFDFGSISDDKPLVTESELNPSIFQRAYPNAVISTEKNDKKCKKMNKNAPKHINKLKKAAKKYGYTTEDFIRKEHRSSAGGKWIEYNFSIWNDNYILDLVMMDPNYNDYHDWWSWGITTKDGRLYDGYSDWPFDYKALLRSVKELSSSSNLPHLDRKGIVIREGEKIELKLKNCKGKCTWKIDYRNKGNIKFYNKKKNSVIIKGTKKGILDIRCKSKGKYYYCRVEVKKEGYTGKTSNDPGRILSDDDDDDYDDDDIDD